MENTKVKHCSKPDAICDKLSGKMYVSEKFGCDEKGDGTPENPFKTVLKVMRYAVKEPFPEIYVDSKDENQKYELIAKSQLKKVQKIWLRESYKENDAANKEKEDAEKRAKNLEEAKQIIIKEDKSLPEAKKIKINQGL